MNWRSEFQRAADNKQSQARTNMALQTVQHLPLLHAWINILFILSTSHYLFAS